MTTPTTTDPVCGMPIRDAEYAASFGGRDYQFCSSTCRARFVVDPEHFLPTAPAPLGA
jgi:Cu+-exporting ATPase